MPISAAYNPAQWATFFSAQVGASAALTGLLFVSISINLSQIISSPHLTPRAAKALITLAGVLFVASLCLVPGQSFTILGWELVCAGTFLGIVITTLQYSASRRNPYVGFRDKLFQSVLTEISAVPIVVCGFSLIWMRGGGLYWLVAGILVSFVSALVDAWVLLIEIKR